MKNAGTKKNRFACAGTWRTLTPVVLSLVVLLRTGEGKAQSETTGADKVAAATPGPVESELPIDERVKRIILRYRTEVSFLMPEGEFNASFEKSFGHFSTLTRARYNFLRGEVEIKNQNLFTQYHAIPQLIVYDKLKFVSLFDRDGIWRREQGMQFGCRYLFGLPANSLTSLNYARFSYPSTTNFWELDSQEIFSLSQSFGAELDSVEVLGNTLDGLFEARIEKAFSIFNSDLNYCQLRLRLRGQSTSRFIALQTEINWITLLRGEKAPLRFLGGRNKLTAFRTNEFNGINLLYFSLKLNMHLLKRSQAAVPEPGLNQFDFVLHGEAGQTGGDRKMRELRAYHYSLGLGVSALCAISSRAAFESFFLMYKAFEAHRDLRYIFGVRF